MHWSFMSDDPRNPPAAPDMASSDSAEAAAAAPNESAAAGAEDAISTDQAKLALRKVKDPELGLNIVDLGLVYEIIVTENNIHVDMTLTSPGCPAGPQIMTDAERVLQALPGVGDVEINLVWSPYWTPERIEPRVRAYMGL
jgi:metal-sulfur cluster biosynthetic enzyme